MSEHPFGGHNEYAPTALSITHGGFYTLIPFTSENLEVFSLRNYLILDKTQCIMRLLLKFSGMTQFLILVLLINL